MSAEQWATFGPAWTPARALHPFDAHDIAAGQVRVPGMLARRSYLSSAYSNLPQFEIASSRSAPSTVAECHDNDAPRGAALSTQLPSGVRRSVDSVVTNEVPSAHYDVLMQSSRVPGAAPSVALRVPLESFSDSPVPIKPPSREGEQPSQLTALKGASEIRTRVAADVLSADVWRHSIVASALASGSSEHALSVMLGVNAPAEGENPVRTMLNGTVVPPPAVSAVLQVTPEPWSDVSAQATGNGSPAAAVAAEDPIRAKTGLFPATKLSSELSEAVTNPEVSAGMSRHESVSEPMSLQGMIVLDGAQISRWMVDQLEQHASRPQTTTTGIDPRMSATYPGAPTGV